MSLRFPHLTLVNKNRTNKEKLTKLYTFLLNKFLFCILYNVITYNLENTKTTKKESKRKDFVVQKNLGFWVKKFFLTQKPKFFCTTKSFLFFTFFALNPGKKGQSSFFFSPRKEKRRLTNLTIC